MFKVIVFLLLFCSCFNGFSQNSFSKDGNYVYVVIDGVLVVQSTTSDWKKEIKGARVSYIGNAFTNNSKNILYSMGDTLCIVKLGTNEQRFIVGVVIIKQPASGNGEWLGYKTKSKTNEMVLLNLNTRKEQHFENISDYSFDNKGNGLVLKTIGQEKATELKWLSLNNGNSITIWSDTSSTILNYCFDSQGDQLAFIVQNKKDGNVVNSIWNYKTGTKYAKLMANDESAGIENGLVIGEDQLSFSKKGSKIIFSLKENDHPVINKDFEKVDVWSYTDVIMQSQQLSKDNKLSPRKYFAVISTIDQHIVHLQQKNEYLLGTQISPSNPQLNDNYALICHFDEDLFMENDMFDEYIMNEYNWNRATQSSIYLVSTNDGSRKLLKQKIKPASSQFPYFRLSPTGKYVIYYDQEQKNYFSYEVATGITHNLTGGVPVSWVTEYPESTPKIRKFYTPSQENGDLHWLENDATFFIYDHYKDLWQVDPSGEKRPVNITGGYAQKNHLNFQWISYENGKVFLRTYNHFKSSDSRYYNKELKKIGNPQQLIKGDNLFIIKASGMDRYLISISHTNNMFELDSCYYTSDFKTINPITNTISVKSNGKNNKKNNQQLVKWKTLDGKEAHGVLFKPENFDSHKKYPIIFNYYEDAGSRGQPMFSSIEIDYCLTHGYLFFVSDIAYNRDAIDGKGESVYYTLVSAAKHLCKMPFVDASKMGITGHSFGGYETNFLVTHTNIFAAAVESCGPTDLISLWGRDEYASGYTSASAVETGQFHLGATLWERPDIYIKNSPIFYADKVNTPLLMIAGGDKDGAVPWIQGVEFFKALRRNGKRAWLLEYKDYGHEVPPDARIRVIQFFDHYLKGAGAPVWMTRGIPARQKGTTLGLEYDTTMKTPGPGLLRDVEARTPQQKELLKHRTTVNTEGRIVNVIEQTKKSIDKKEK